ncbi:MAG TPA: hypothetical protein VEK33_20205 [Terriglobales bacterium]|nr:hypothetical protein [Terriglobales bacterium]
MKTRMLSILGRSAAWARNHKLRTAALVLVLVAFMPHAGNGQFLDPCCAILAAGLTTISNTLGNVVGGNLNSILSIEQSISNFEQQVVWPVNLINQARALVGNLQGTFNQIQGLSQISVNSATLPESRQLEQNLLSHDPNQIAQTTAAYDALYGTVPAETDASAQVRDLIDMTDAAAQTAMKRAIEIDALADLELEAAGRINQSVQNAAPGSAPIVEAQAGAWLIRANAYTQAATADLMRLRAVDLADSSAELKMGASNTANLRQGLINLLEHN